MTELPFTIGGVVIHGKHLGTRLGFPTANLDYPQGVELPPNGVYVAEALLDGRHYVAILNQGHHPTAPEGRATIETHMLGFHGGDLYGQSVTLCYRAWLRPESKFPSLDALKEQLRLDLNSAREWTRHNKPILPDGTTEKEIPWSATT